ncbi:hypothetical protein DERF_001247 [Dermatophagoides farinae]|uniref:Uncharacterized protein n=1 Tax=Dermatophagoides farinae TaxID=6954 RepID=A0A922L8H4_DERFA|nr:hypothetical protein DERF_001247 [Dermatophagoides farinae]
MYTDRGKRNGNRFRFPGYSMMTTSINTTQSSKKIGSMSFPCRVLITYFLLEKWDYFFSTTEPQY